MKTHGDSALKIGGKEQRQLGVLLQTIEQFGGLIGLAAIEERRLPAHRHGERADVILAHGVAQLQILGAVDVEELRPHPDHEKLSDFFLEGELAQGLLRPFFAVTVEMNGAGVLIFFLGQGGHTDGQEQEENSQRSDHGRTIARRATECQRRRAEMPHPVSRRALSATSRRREASAR